MSTGSRLRRLAAVLAMTVAVTVPIVEPATAGQTFVHDARVSPTQLPSSGGQVVVTATVTSDLEVDWVYADLVSSAGEYLQVPMSATGGGAYSGSGDLPTNTQEYETTWDVSVWARDVEEVYGTAPAGTVMVEGNPPFDEAPVVYDPLVAPAALPSTGGPVDLQVSAWDLRGILEAVANITPGPTIPLEGISDVRFRGSWVAPANTGPTAQTYTVTFLAYDDIGQSTSLSGGTVVVDPPPPPPEVAPGRLVVKPAELTFRRAAVGTTATRTVRLSSTRGAADRPIAVVLRAAGAGYSLPGAPPDGLRVTVRPGKAVRVDVAFRPEAAGASRGALVVERVDGGQPPLTIVLRGSSKPGRR